MGTKRIKDLTPTEYNGSYKVAVDDNNGTKSLEISKIKVYDVATTSSNGLMSSSDKTKLNDIENNANNYVHPSYTSKSSGLYKVTVDGSGHISGATAVTKSDITGLGIPGSDTNTTYSFANGTNGFTVTPSNGSAQTVTVTPSIANATQSSNGLMSSSDKTKLDGINIVVCTQAEYDASAKTAGTFYFIKES